MYTWRMSRSCRCQWKTGYKIFQRYRDCGLEGLGIGSVCIRGFDSGPFESLPPVGEALFGSWRRLCLATPSGACDLAVLDCRKNVGREQQHKRDKEIYCDESHRSSLFTVSLSCRTAGLEIDNCL